MKGHTVIHTNQFGYVSRCNCCGELQLCLGNIVLVLGKRDFVNFKQSFFGLNNESTVRLHRGGSIKRYTFFTSYSDLTLSLSKQEFRLTADLLNLAEMDQMIKNELSSI